MDNSLFTDTPAPESSLFTDTPAPESSGWLDTAGGALNAVGSAALRNFPMGQQLEAAAVPTLNTIAGATTSPLLKPGIDFLTQTIVPEAEKMVGSPQGLIPTGTYSENLNNLVSKAEQAKSDYPIPYDIGAVAGSVAPAFMAAPEGVLSNAVLGAGLGAAQNISDIPIAPNYKLNPEVVKPAAIGAGIGGITGAAAGKLSNFLTPEVQKVDAAGKPILDAAGKPIIDDTKTGNIAEGLSNRYAVQAAGIPAQTLEGMSEKEINELGDFIRSRGIMKDNPFDSLAAAKAVKEEAGQWIGEISKVTDAYGNPGYNGGAIKSTLDQKIASLAGASNKQAVALKNAYTIAGLDIDKLGNNPSFSQLQALKDQYADLAFRRTGSIKDTAAAHVAGDVYGLISGAQDNIVKATENAINTDPDFQGSIPYEEAKTNYKNATTLANAYLKATGHVAAEGEESRAIGMIGRMIGKVPGMSEPGLNLPLGALLAASGHGMLGLGAITPTIGNPRILSNAFSTIPPALSKMAPGAAMELTNFLEQAYNNQ